MTIPDDKPSFFDRPNLFAHIYTTHASKIIQDYIATNRKDKIRRAKIETDIIRLTNEDPDLPIPHKVSCTSMILHTNTFESFWADQKLAYSLSAKSLKRLKPKYKLIDELPCPPDDDSSALSPLENFTDKNGNSRHNSAALTATANTDTKTKTTAAKRGRGRPKSAPAKANGKARNAKAATTTTKRNIKAQTARASQSGASIDESKQNGSNANVQATQAQQQETKGRPRGKTGIEAYWECMAQGLNERSLRGPSSDEEATTTDDDSDSEAP